MPFFVLSLKAGGSGLNLTAASHVVHFDRWWNPAVENQATDRAFRIGQKRNVLVHKFVCRGTVEEKIDALIESKQGVSDELLSGAGEINLTEMKDDDLLKLVASGSERRDEGLSAMSRYHDYGGWAPYVPVAERRRKAEREIEKLRKKGHPVAPVVIEGAPIAATFWGKAWCDNLESYRDYANRLSRGRTYVRNGSVVDLQIAPREVTAMVSGSSIYHVTISIGAVAEGAMAVDPQRLRGWDRFPGGAAAGPLLQGRHGAHLPPGPGAVSPALRYPLHVQLPGLRVDVQARRGGAVRRRGTARPTAGAAVSSAWRE